MPSEHPAFEVQTGSGGEVDARALVRLLGAEISDGNPDAFGANVEVLLSLAREEGGEHRLGPAEVKAMLRHLARRFEERSGNRIFSLGVYQSFFPCIRPAGDGERERAMRLLPLLGQISGLVGNEALTVQALRPILLRLWGTLCEGLPSEETGGPNGQLLAWALFESLLRGVLSVETFSTAERSFHYLVLCAPEQMAACLADERRQVLLADFRFAVGDAFPRRPSVVALLRGATALSPSDRALLVQAVQSWRPTEVEPFAHLLRHHGFMIACAEEDLRAPYFDLVDALFGHLLTAVLGEGRDERSSVLRVYLTLLRERHLPRLRRYCDAMREARQGAELYADLLYEPYLTRLGALGDNREPSLLALLEDWMAIQWVMERQQGFQGDSFSLTDGLLAWERSWMESRRQGRPAGVGEGDGLGREEAPVAGVARRSSQHSPIEYTTFVRLPVQPPPAPEVAWTAASVDGAPNPFGEEAVTDPYGVPQLGAELFDAVTRRLPVMGSAFLDGAGGPTLLVPSDEGRAGALHRAATIILPAVALGADEAGLHQAATLIFPVQSVPVSRNEAICRRVDVLLAAAQDRSQRSSERLRSELQMMPDEDRIIAEQYLAQAVEREMSGISRRLEAAIGMSTVTLDDFAGSLLSSVLRDLVVTGYLRRVFMAECVGLYGRALAREPRDRVLVESLQLALFTVLNAHQDRLELPPEVDAGLRALAALPQEQPLPTRLPYRLPTPVALPPDLSARVARSGSWRLVFDAEHLLVGHLQELERTVEKVSSLTLFSDLEAALGDTGFGPETYLALCGQLRERIRLMLERFRGLFLRLEEAGAESAELERFFLELIGYGRAVWSSSLIPALGFYAKMAFGVRDGEKPPRCP